MYVHEVSSHPVVGIAYCDKHLIRAGIIVTLAKNRVCVADLSVNPVCRSIYPQFQEVDGEQHSYRDFMKWYRGFGWSCALLWPLCATLSLWYISALPRLDNPLSLLIKFRYFYLGEHSHMTSRKCSDFSAPPPLV